MKTQIKYILFGLVILAAAGCIKTIPFEKAEAPPVLVANGFITEGAPLSLDITASKNLLNGDYQFETVSGCTVRLFENGQFLENAEEMAIGDFNNGVIYIGNSLLQAGKTYRIEVEHPSYPSISASTTIPPKPLTPEVSNEGNTEDRTKVKMVLNDIPDVKNYYHFFPIETEQFNLQPFESDDNFLEGGAVDPFENGSPWYNSGALLTDVIFENGSVIVTFNYFDYVFTDPGGPDLPADQLELINCSEDYYRFHLTRIADGEGDFQVFAQPVQVHSNVSGGFGIFAGYNSRLTEIPDEE